MTWQLFYGSRLCLQGGYDKDQPGLASPGARSGAATWHPHAQPAANGAAAEPQAWTSRLADVPAKPPSQPAASDAPAAGAALQGLESAAPCAVGPAPVRLPALPGSIGAPASSAGAAPEVPGSALPPDAAPEQLPSGALGGGGGRSTAQEPAVAAASPAAAPDGNAPAANRPAGTFLPARRCPGAR